MGIFEKSIPKYTYNLANEVVVDPQDVYVDDIFDPILNARVRDAMRQKYGGGLYGVVGGYEELLKNTWTGREGIFGPGMGLLSTFGRSMEKADDIVLGALTEGIKGLSGQGAVNPIENIFVNDVDYTGRGLLAATTNIASPLMGGTRVDESDFGSAWTIPALGLELGTDVGILGGTLSRKLAPGASKLTSKQLFENLGKSDLKTSVGEIGQLMSNYDDLMTKVALDVSAPGLRPAMKGLMNRIAELVKLNSPKAFSDHTILRNNPDVRKAAKEFYSQQELNQLLAYLESTYEKLPVSKEELAETISKTIDDAGEVSLEAVAESPYEHWRFIKNILESDDYARFKETVNVQNSNLAHATTMAADKFDRAFASDVQKTLDRIDEKKYKVDFTKSDSDIADAYENRIKDINSAVQARKEISPDELRRQAEELEWKQAEGEWVNEDRINGLYTAADLMERAEAELDEIRQIIRNTVGDVESGASKPVKLDVSKISRTAEDNNAIRLLDLIFQKPYDASLGIGTPNYGFPLIDEKYAQMYRTNAREYVKKHFRQGTDAYTFALQNLDQIAIDLARSKLDIRSPQLQAAQVSSEARNVITAPYKDAFKRLSIRDSHIRDWENARPKRSKDILSGVNKTYADEILEKLTDDDKLLEALESGMFTDNAAANSAILRALGDPAYGNRLWYAKANPKVRVSPSMLPKVQEYGAKGTAYAHARLDLVRYAYGSPKHIRFNNRKELNAYLNSKNMQAALYKLISTDYIERTPENLAKGMKTVRKEYLSKQYSKFKRLVADVYYPKPKKGHKYVSVKEYTLNLNNLSEFLDNLVEKRLPDIAWQKAPNESLFLDDLIRAFDETALDGRFLGIDQVYLQKVRSEMPSTKSARRIQGELSDSAYELSEDYSTSFASYMRTILSQISAQVKTEDDLKYIVEPILKYIQVIPNSSGNAFNKTLERLASAHGMSPHEFLQAPNLRDVLASEMTTKRLIPSKTTLDTVREFQTSVLPRLRSALSRGINPLDFKAKYKGEDAKLYNEARALLGITSYDVHGNPIAKHPNGYANRLMFEALGGVPGLKLSHPLSVVDKYRTRYLLEDAAMKANLSQPPIEFQDFKPENTLTHLFSDPGYAFADALEKAEKGTPVKALTQEATRAKNIAIDAIVSAPPEAAAELAYNVPSLAIGSVESVISETFGDEVLKFIQDGGDDKAFRMLYGEEAWNLYKKIAEADAVSSINSFRKNRATLRQKPVKAVLERAFKLRGDHLMNGGKMSDFRRFVTLRQQPYGDIVQGKDFWNELRHSGMLGAVYAKGSADADAVFDSLTKNANIINELVEHPIVKVVRKDIPNDKQKIYLQFVKNKKGVVWINDAAEKLEKAAFETVTFSPPKAWTAEDLAFMNSDTMRELSAIMDEVQVLAADQAKYLGFAFDTSSQYTKHAMRRNPDTAQWFSDTFYTDFSSEDLDEFVNSISNLERYRKADHGAFGTTVNTRRFRGDVWMMDDGNKVRFNYDPYEMVTSTLADGTFANLQFQSYVDLFMNDNFKIKGWFNTIDDLKEVLYKPLEGGGTSGNLRNLELCTMKLDANGKIIGLTKYDKLSDAGLQKALADENCILVPTNAVSHMDNLLKKDIRMSNKFWTFVNKHFTIPFKFGVLSNPGFLLGNMSDSYLKLATTMSQKYGTTVQEEAQRVAGCIQRAGKYREDYGTAFEVWRKVSKDNGIKLSPEATVPGIVSMSPKYNEQFLEWLDGRLQVEKTLQDPVTGKIETKLVPVPCDLSDNVKNAASTWVMLQSAQMNSDKLREFASLAELANTSEFEMPTNIWDRVLQGKGKYDKHKPSTWGLFMNNPAMSAMLKASGGWEDVIRTASILDDLEHGYTLEELGVLSRGQKFTDADINFRVKLDEAKNTMYNAQFDYERGSDFMEGVGKVVPFPVFFLKNFAYWMELFSENPQYVDNAIDIQEGLWGNKDEENSKDEFAVQAKGRGAIPIGGDALPKWFKGIYKPSPLQSMFGAFSLLNSPVQDLQYRVNPLISGGAAALAKEFPNDLTTSLMPQEETKYRPYSTDMYERNVKASDPNFNPLEYAVHRANPYERMVNTYLRTPEKIKRGEAQLSDFVPSVFQPDF